MYKYFISYCFKIKIGYKEYELGNAVIDLGEELKNHKSIFDLEEHLKKDILDNNNVKVDILIIQNIIKL